MKLGKSTYVATACLMIGLFALAGIGGAGDIGGVTKKACSTCHSTKRICMSLGNKSADEWKTTVGRMVAKGARLAPHQIDTAAGYLAGLKPSQGTVCD